MENLILSKACAIRLILGEATLGMQKGAVSKKGAVNGHLEGGAILKGCFHHESLTAIQSAHLLEFSWVWSSSLPTCSTVEFSS